MFYSNYLYLFFILHCFTPFDSYTPFGRAHTFLYGSTPSLYGTPHHYASVL